MYPIILNKLDDSIDPPACDGRGCDRTADIRLDFPASGWTHRDCKQCVQEFHDDLQAHGEPKAEIRLPGGGSR